MAKKKQVVETSAENQETTEETKKDEKVKYTGDPLLDAAINKLNKSFGKNMITEKPKIKNIPSITTGSLSLDLALGYGGYPRGRLIELFGPEAAGKTSLALAGAAQAQKMYPDRYVLIIDMEYTMNEDFIAGFGIDMSRVVFGQCDTAEQAFQTTKDLTNTGKICFLVFDSIDACQAEATLKKDIGEADFGGISKMAARFFREYSKICTRVECTAIFINQEKDTLAMYGPKKTTPGGSALKFYSSLRMKAKQIQPSKTVSNAYINTLEIKKNKGAPAPAEPVIFEFVYGKGPDALIDTINAGKEMEVLFFQGVSTRLKVGDTVEVLSSKGGKDGFIEAAKQDPTLISKIRQACELARGPVELIEEEVESEEEHEEPEVTSEESD